MGKSRATINIYCVRCYTKNMKRALLITITILLIGFAPHVFATEGFISLSSIPGLTDVQTATDGFAGFFNNLYKYLVGIAAVLAVIMIIWGGLEYSTQDSVSKKSDCLLYTSDAADDLTRVDLG